MRLALVLATSCSLVVPAATGQEAGKLLSLFSDNRLLLPADVEVDRASREALVATPNRYIEICPEFLDQPAFPGAVYEQTVATEDRDNVFEPSWSTNAAGIGVGLAIGQSIVAAHRRTLAVTNHLDGGAASCVTLSICQRD